MKKALIVVDFQNDFVSGALGFAGADRLDAIICKKIEENKENADIIFTFDTHFSDYLSTKEGERLPIPHCIQGTQGHKLYGKTADFCTGDSICFDKPTFGSVELGQFLRERQYEQVELCGLVSNICVLSNAILAKAFLPEAEVIVDSCATDSFDQTLHQEALDVLRGVQIAVLS